MMGKMEELGFSYIGTEPDFFGEGEIASYGSSTGETVGIDVKTQKWHYAPNLGGRKKEDMRSGIGNASLFAMLEGPHRTKLKGFKPRAFRRLSSYKTNPSKPVKIYNRIIDITASKAGMPHNCDAKCKEFNHVYRHKFEKKSCIYGLSDGSILIK